ncbi:hypothetical protein ASZ78_005098, partial [Callipepla squamata]
YAVPPPTSQPNYSSTYTIIQQPAATTSVVVVGGCPACSRGSVVEEEGVSCVLSEEEAQLRMRKAGFREKSCQEALSGALVTTESEERDLVVKRCGF